MRRPSWFKLLRAGVFPGCLSLSLIVPLLAPAAPPPSSPAPDQPVRFDILDGGANGVLLPGAKLTLSVQLTGKPVAQKDEWVAIVEADAFPTRLVPMTRDEEQKALTASVFFEPYAEKLLAAKQKAIRINVVFARRRGMGLEPLLKQAVYVTVGRPADAGPNATAEPPPAVKDEAGPAHESVQLDPEAVSEETIREEELLPAPPMIQSRAYWKTVNDRISRSWKQAVRQQGKSTVRRSPRVRFRLYANGEAQLVQVERSSGDRRVDDAGLQAVIDAHPFPPMPPAFSDPHVDVHVDLPGPPR